MNRFVTYDYKHLQPGGVGHSMMDYITCLIFARLFDVKFIHQKLYTNTSHTCGMNISSLDTKDNYFWNDFLNLDYFYCKYDTGKCTTIPIKSSISFSAIDINQLKNIVKRPNIQNNVIYYFKGNTRIFLFDTFQMEKRGLIPFGITKSVIDDLKISFRKNNCRDEPPGIFQVSIYIRCGDLMKHNEKNFFEYRLFCLLYEKLKDISHMQINIISAGTVEEMTKIQMLFSKFKYIKFYLNDNEVGKIFKLMVFSKILIYNFSSFPVLASFYSDGLIIKNKHSIYLFSKFIYKNFQFLDNFLFVNLDCLNDIKIVYDKITHFKEC
jgi:hypothetical protein